MNQAEKFRRRMLSVSSYSYRAATEQLRSSYGAATELIYDAT